MRSSESCFPIRARAAAPPEPMRIAPRIRAARLRGAAARRRCRRRGCPPRRNSRTRQSPARPPPETASPRRTPHSETPARATPRPRPPPTRQDRGPRHRPTSHVISCRGCRVIALSPRVPRDAGCSCEPARAFAHAARAQPRAGTRRAKPALRDAASPRGSGGVIGAWRHELRRPREHTARILIRHSTERVVERKPRAGRNPLLALRRRGRGRALHEEEVTDLVYETAAKPKVPIYGIDRPAQRQRVQTGFFFNLAQRRRLEGFVGLDVSFGEPPIVVRVPDEQEQRSAIHDTIHDAARRRLLLGPRPHHQKILTLRYWRGCARIWATSSRICESSASPF